MACLEDGGWREDSASTLSCQVLAWNREVRTKIVAGGGEGMKHSYPHWRGQGHAYSCLRAALGVARTECVPLYLHQPSGSFQVHVAQGWETTFLWAGLRGLARSKTEAERKERLGGERKEVKEWNKKGRGVCVKGPGRQVEEGERDMYCGTLFVEKNNNPQQHKGRGSREQPGVRGDSQGGLLSEFQVALKFILLFGSSCRSHLQHLHFSLNYHSHPSSPKMSFPSPVNQTPRTALSRFLSWHQARTFCWANNARLP